MNGLSWLIYLAKIVGSLNGFLCFITAILCFSTVVSVFVALVFLDETSGYRRLEGDDLVRCRKIQQSARKIATKFAIFAILSGITLAVIPDRQTVLLIAASEIGEKVVTSERVQGVIDPSVELLKTWITQQTEVIRRNVERETNRNANRNANR
jgi:hypothetical protein